MIPEAAVFDSPSPTWVIGPYRESDYFRLPDEPRCELLAGRFYVSPSPNVLHQIIVGLLWEILQSAARATGGVAIFAPMDVVLSENSVVQPDVLYITRSRRAIVREKVHGAPDLVVEVVSPGAARRDRVEKLRLYAEAGVREYWLCDPAARVIDFLVNRGGRYEVALAHADVYASAELPEVRIDLAEFWSEVDARQIGPEPA